LFIPDWMTVCEEDLAMDVNKLRQRLIDAGRLQTERDIELFDAMSEQAPEILALVYAAALAGVTVTDSELNGFPRSTPE
jgi:hypothetical protein